MRTMLSIVIAGLLAACAGTTPMLQGGGALHSRWRGFLLHDGLRKPVTVELTQGGSAWDGRFSAGDNAVALSSVRVSSSRVHFELPGEGVFDGAVAGDSMAGEVSGPVSGSFFLTRFEEISQPESPYFLGP